MIEFKNVEELGNKINESLYNSDWIKKFQYKRKELAKKKQAAGLTRLFITDKERGWCINKGGGTEIQYQIGSFDISTTYYGLGINTKYIPFSANSISDMAKYMQPFANAYLSIKDSDLVKRMKANGFDYIYCTETDLEKLENNRYYMFGKKIAIKQDGIPQNVFDEIISDLKGNMYDLYCKIFEKRNELTDFEKKEEIMPETKIYVDLLKANKNLILTGAPGTGKTYKTAEIALSILKKDTSKPRGDLMEDYRQAIEDGYIAFTTFHQSLDYEEFVEGLKPNCENDNMTYEVKAGIFKEICERARKIEFIESGGVDNFDEAWSKFIEEVQAKEETEPTYKDAKTITGKDMELVSYIDGSGVLIVKFGENGEIYRNGRFLNKEQCYNVYRGLKGTPKGGLDNYRKAIVEHLKDKFDLKDYFESQIKTDKKTQSFVLIIDEINRGNVSKIFGELITLLEKDKRLGEENAIEVILAYSQKRFGVPSNLYIIGTMNTADRSIGHIDYAIRRRFAFHTIQADINVITTIPEAKTLFDNIKSFITTNINDDLDADDLMIGHSYFICKNKDELKMRLKYEIIPLIKEYYKDGIIKDLTVEKVEEWQNLVS